MQAAAELVWRVRTSGHASARFQVRAVQVDIDFDQREKDGPWHVSFGTSGDSPISSALRIFEGVFDAVREFAGVREPGVLVFMSKDEDLAEVFGSYLGRDKEKIEQLGYTLEGPHHVEPYTQWTLRRNRPSEWRLLSER